MTVTMIDIYKRLASRALCELTLTRTERDAVNSVLGFCERAERIAKQPDSADFDTVAALRVRLPARGIA